MSKQKVAANAAGRACARAGRGPGGTARHGIVIAGACAAFGVMLVLEDLTSSALEVRIECSSKGMDFASWMPESKWVRSARSGSVTMAVDGFFVTVPVDDCSTSA
jgi:hypothetical protein